jgi:8-oxo-dGTP pyrophosphatase MutT (NUDIX family)
MMRASGSKGSGIEAKAQALRPRDAASLIIVDRATGEPRVLMGKRRLDQVFIPGKYVFPGGGVDKSDRLIASADELRPVEMAKLLLDMKGTPSQARARALALAAIRETFEEAGLLIGAPAARPLETADKAWSAFFAQGFWPKLSALTFVARAITPPGRPRRYDTRFFYAEAEAIAHRVETRDGELSALHWITIEEAGALDLPVITRVILEDLADHLKTGARSAAACTPIPYYYHKNGSFRRDRLTVP